MDQTELFATKSSAETLDWAIQLIDHAEQSIEISGCYFAGETALKILTHMEKALQRNKNLQVKILYSPVLFNHKLELNLLNQLKKTFPMFEVIESAAVFYMTPECALVENHEKYVIVDELYFTLGGTNLEDSMCTVGLEKPKKRKIQSFLDKKMQSACRDQDVVGRSRVIAQNLRSHFYQLIEMWKNYDLKQSLTTDLQSYTPAMLEIDQTKQQFFEPFERDPRKVLLADNQVEILYAIPFSHNPITSAFEQSIEQAKKNIVIASLYFNPQGEILKKLSHSIHSGTDCTIVSNGVHKNISPASTDTFAWSARLHYFPLFFRDNITQKSMAKHPSYNLSVYEYAVFDTLYHKKILVVDNSISFVGSYNLGLKSHHYDFEVMLKIHSEEIATQILENIEEDKQKSIQLQPQEVAGWYFNPWISFLGNVTQNLSSSVY